MFVTVIHEIRTRPASSRRARGPGQGPEESQPLQFLPSADKKRAVCVWEADTIDNLKRFIESKIGSASKDTYFTIDAKTAVGLPQKQPA
jgi:hypothetical protein